jgi:hypothetical protein
MDVLIGNNPNLTREPAMKHEERNSKPESAIYRASTPRAMAFAVVLASAGTVLLNTLLNGLPHSERAAPLPANAIAPTHNSTPYAPTYREPRSIPPQHVNHAEAKL